MRSMECLQLVENRRADFVAVDPEDMYVALNMKNEDFAVFSEIRTVEESQSAFRYLGIILVRKSSPIRTLADLKGTKSCHTGYGRNVGYKIPITKLKNAGVLKISDDPQLSYVEKELQGLTELFAQSCLVGKWSPNEDVNTALSECERYWVSKKKTMLIFVFWQRNATRICAHCARTRPSVTIRTSTPGTMARSGAWWRTAAMWPSRRSSL